MFRKMIKLTKEPLIIGSFWLTAGGLIANAGNFIFNLLMGRFLNPSEYGILMSLLSLSVVVSLPSSLIITISTKFSAEFLVKKEQFKITRMLRVLTKYTFFCGLTIILIFSFFNNLLQDFLKVYDDNLIIITGIFIAIGFISSINQGVYKGLLYFKVLSILGVVGIIVKLIFGWYFVYSGFSVFGALLGVILGALIPWLISFVPIKDLFKEKTKKLFGLRKKIILFSLPAFIVTAYSTFFLNTDLLLVKHFFNPNEAGIYAASAIMGKSIFYALSPISTVFFPLIVQRFAIKGNMKKDLSLSILITSVLGLIAVALYFIYPQLIIKIFFPNPLYSSSTHFIGFYAIYMLLFSLAFLIIYFLLAVEKLKAIYFSSLFPILQIVLIVLFHNSLRQVLIVSIIALFTFVLFSFSILARGQFIKER